MKFATVSKTLVLGLALLLASSAFAATKASLQLQSAVTVAGTTLKPGEYKLEWDGAGPNVEVSIMQGKNVVAKAPGHLVDLNTPAANSAAVVKSNNDGSNSLVGARFEGKKYSLELGSASEGGQAGSAQ
jgi:hypothetical protein